MDKPVSKEDKLDIEYLQQPKYVKNVAGSYILAYFAIFLLLISIIPAANCAKDIIVEVESDIKVSYN
jgi:hypothetical protein